MISFREGKMKIKLNNKEYLWMVIGALILLVVILVALHFQAGQKSVTQLAFKARRLDLVAQMRLDLASASEAEKSAVLAITDQESKTFADQAREATGKVEREHNELEELLAIKSIQKERDLLIQFSRGFTDFQRIDSNLLVLATKNTNIKAYGLTFGPAADALKEMDTALSRLVTKSADFPEARNVTLLACDAQIAALRIQTLLAPHIAEESDRKMDELEAQMTKEDMEVRKDLGSLAAIREYHGNPDLEIALSNWARFSEVKGRIIALSRENTNVKSLTISLGQKRKVLFLCQDLLSALQQTILDEPIMGVNYGSVSNPRSLQLETPKNK
jgi:hypothetical protein